MIKDNVLANRGNYESKATIQAYTKAVKAAVLVIE